VRDPARVSPHPEAIRACHIHADASAGSATHPVTAVAIITTAIVPIMIPALRARLHAILRFSSE